MRGRGPRAAKIFTRAGPATPRPTRRRCPNATFGVTAGPCGLSLPPTRACRRAASRDLRSLCRGGASRATTGTAAAEEDPRCLMNPATRSVDNGDAFANEKGIKVATREYTLREEDLPGTRGREHGPHPGLHINGDYIARQGGRRGQGPISPIGRILPHHLRQCRSPIARRPSHMPRRKGDPRRSSHVSSLTV